MNRMSEELYREAYQAYLANEDAKALRLLKQCAKLGFSLAIGMLGHFYFCGKGLARPNYKRAVQNLEKAVRVGVVDALPDLAYCAFWGRGMRRDRHRAIELYSDAIVKGVAGGVDGLFDVGAAFLKGDRVRRDFTMAFLVFKCLAVIGNVDAMYNVAWAYDTGNGVTQDKKMAAEWYRKAIKKGCRDAMYNLSLLYEQGAGVRRNRAVAKRLRDAYESHDET